MKRLLFFGVAFFSFHISHSQLEEFCLLPPDEGQGTDFNFALYYDQTTDQCQPFLYKGQGGNANRFSVEIECIRNCSVNKENIYPMEAAKACHFPKAVGKCSARIMSFYYDSIHGKCKKFHWSGCIGNGNRFSDQGICNATCAGIHDDGDAPEEDDSDTPVAIICGVLLSVIIATIFITVAVLTVKSKKKEAMKNGQKKSKDAAPEIPLQEQSNEVA